MAEEHHESGGGKVARRALLATAGVGACAAAAAATPWALSKASDLGKNAADAAFQQGLLEGRKRLLEELKTLENVTLADAINLAELARDGINGIVIPAAKLISLIGTGALDTLYNALGSAISALANVNQHIQWLSETQSMVGQWRDNIKASGLLLSSVLNADISSIEIYLKAVKTKVDEESTPAPTTSPRSY